jgi:thiol:disulfide interchange protein DsbC
MSNNIIVWFLALCSVSAWAQEKNIRKNLPARLPNLPKIEEVRPTPMPGLYEVRVNHSEIYYTDAQGNFLIDGSLVDTRARMNLTEERQNRLTAISFKDLPLKDAFTLVRGNGKRVIAVFEDPNCGYCKRFERDLLKVNNITVHVFLYPILGPDSAEKSKHIWCAKDKGNTFLDWMTKDEPPAKASCDTSAVERNVELGRKLRITGTPTLFLTNGTRVPGAIGADRLEKMLADVD